MWRTGRSETFLYVQEPTEAMWEVQAPFQTSAAQQWVRTQRALRAPGRVLWKERTTLVVLYLSIFFSEQILAYPFKRNNGFSSMLWNLLPFKSKGTCCLIILLIEWPFKRKQDDESRAGFLRALGFWFFLPSPPPMKCCFTCSLRMM